MTTERRHAVFVSTRYDRRLEDGRWHRLHQEDLCQALSVPPDTKYQFEGGPGIAAIARLINSSPCRSRGSAASDGSPRFAGQGGGAGRPRPRLG
nr:HipA domain-containing protein [Microbacterium bovistercoris]